MFARIVLFKVKPDCHTKLTRTLDQEVLPLLRSEKNFRGAVALIFPQGTRAILFSLWSQTGNSGANCATSLSARVAWQEWSWQLGWFKSRRSLEFPNPHHGINNSPRGSS